jgi:hypothetical protein
MRRKHLLPLLCIILFIIFRPWMYFICAFIVLTNLVSISYSLTCNTIFFPLALQPQFGPWPTSMKLSVSLRFTRS